jgi:tRNA threonylcarbamoyladenosine biosynthesis protein TsaB
MCLLALDTSASSCSVAVVRGGELLSEMTVMSPAGAHNRQLMPLVHEVLRQAGLGLNVVDTLAVTVGPGTFTGLRVGLATAQGLALAGGQALLGISTLEAMATQALPYHGLICSLLDARRGEVYLACYRAAGRSLTPVGGEGVGPLDSLLPPHDEPRLFIGAGLARWQAHLVTRLGARAQLAPPWQNVLRASTVAALAAEQMARRGVPEGTVPELRYLRAADAVPRASRRACD